jgi:Ca2+-binding EF-hand superfamily protein
MSSSFPFGGAARIPQSYPFSQQIQQGGQSQNSSSNQLQQQNTNASIRRRPPRLELDEGQKTEIREAFEIFDMDKDGALDFHEFKVFI